MSGENTRIDRYAFEECNFQNRLLILVSQQQNRIFGQIDNFNDGHKLVKMNPERLLHDHSMYFVFTKFVGKCSKWQFFHFGHDLRYHSRHSLFRNRGKTSAISCFVAQSAQSIVFVQTTLIQLALLAYVIF